MTRQPKYQYKLFGVAGEFMGITTKLAIAQAHRDAAPTAYYYRRFEYDPNDPNWETAQTQNLICIR